ncbi:MAG: 23S rRNA (uracil(1939)-C(5))-methyltransferase RlmD [Bacteroidales bacterium]|nr:23S rRNA (uracil(1939)-C(5))-methyltransferase RlmD [Bacteroidales bacterium]
MGRNKKLPIIENLKIIDIAAEGKAIGKIDDIVVFVPQLIPGDVADIQIRKKRKNYLEGRLLKLKKKSPLRTDPICSHFGICGGCKWQHLPYEKQLYYKQKQVSDNLQRIGKVDLPEIRPIAGSERTQYYRNKLEFTFSETRWLSDEEVKSDKDIQERRALGFHISGRFDRILDIEQCKLQNDLSNNIRNSIRNFTLKEDYSYYNQKYNTGLLRNLIIRNTESGQWMVILVFREDEKKQIKKLMKYVSKEFPELDSLLYIINSKLNDTFYDLDFVCYQGKDHIIEELDGLQFKIGPKSFFQTNTLQAAELYRNVLDFASPKKTDLIFDLYTGTGTIALFLARYCKQVIGIEYVKEAIDDAVVNADINNIKNAQFFFGDINDILTSALIKEYSEPDIIVTDPPRAGMHAGVIQKLIKIAPKKIVYISCNPATQARDIHLLKDDYKVKAIQPVDMFPHTHHVENVVLLDRN